MMGRTTIVDQPDTLDATGNSIANITHTSYTLSGEISAVWGDQTNPTFRVYDEQDRLTGLRTYRNLAHGTQPTASTPNYDATAWNYDAKRGWLVNKRDAATLGADYAYTLGGRLSTRQWARTIGGGARLTTNFGYTEGRLTSTSYNDVLTPSVSYSYDAFGRQQTITQPGNSWVYAYDPENLQLKTETITYDTDFDGTGDFTRVLDRSRDAKLRPSGYELKSGGTVETGTAYTYDPAGRLGTVTGAGDTFTYGYETNSYALVHSVAGPTHTVTNTWESNRDVLASKENKAGANVISSYSYSVNEIGQRTALVRSGDIPVASSTSTGWGYNARGEVTSADHSDIAQSRFYQYDTIGNRQKSRDGTATGSGGTLVNYSANGLNQYTSINSVALSYDPDGNQLSGPLPKDPTQSAGYTWDAENRLIEAKGNGTTIGQYRYDPFGRRIAKTVGTATAWFIYDGWNLIAEHGGGTLLRSHLWGKDLSGSPQGAGGVGGLLVSRIASSNYYPLYDGNGNVSEYLDSTGTTAAHFEYDAFGKLTANTDSAGLFAFRFSTKYQDFETALLYYGYRYYKPNDGGWLSRDPAQEWGGTNLYAFVGNCAVDFVDILGLCDCPSKDSGGETCCPEEMEDVQFQIDTSRVGHAQLQLPNDKDNAWGFFPMDTF